MRIDEPFELAASKGKRITCLGVRISKAFSVGVVLMNMADQSQAMHGPSIVRRVSQSFKLSYETIPKWKELMVGKFLP